jgi:hypothetical protein
MRPARRALPPARSDLIQLRSAPGRPARHLVAAADADTSTDTVDVSRARPDLDARTCSDIGARAVRPGSVVARPGADFRARIPAVRSEPVGARPSTDLRVTLVAVRAY